MDGLSPCFPRQEPLARKFRVSFAALEQWLYSSPGLHVVWNLPYPAHVCVCVCVCVCVNHTCQHTALSTPYVLLYIYSFSLHMQTV